MARTTESPGRRALERIVASPVQASQVRRFASTTLGMMQDSRSIPALLAAARSSDDGVARRAIEALGTVGTRETLSPLSRLRARTPVVRRSLAFALSFIAHRHGVKGWPLQLPHDSREMPIDADRAVMLRCKSLPRKKWSALLPKLQVIAEVAPPEDKPPLTFGCGSEEFLLLVNPLLERGAPALTRPLVAAALMRLSHTEQEWHVAEYLLCDAASGGRTSIVGARPTGTVVHTGFAVTEHEDVSVKLQSLVTPLARPVLVSAAIGPTVDRGLQFQALVERQASAAGRRVPTRLGA